MIISSLEHVFKNIRYKLLHIDDEYYLLDMDRSFFSFVFPFIYWFVPHPVYQIDKLTVEKLEMPEEEKGSRMWMVFPATGISLILGRQLSTLSEGFDDSMSFFLTIIVLIILFFIIIGFRFFLYHSRYNKMNNIVKLDTLPKRFIKIRPEKIGSYFQAIFYYLFSLGISLLFGFGYVEIQKFFMGIAFAIITPLFLVSNTLVIPVGSIKVTYLKGNNKGA